MSVPSCYGPRGDGHRNAGLSGLMGGCSPHSELYGCKGSKPGRDGIRPGSLLFQVRPVPCGLSVALSIARNSCFRKVQTYPSIFGRGRKKVMGHVSVLGPFVRA